ncbi:MAG: TatD family hydrolase [Candidatus Paceibacterota bacterium]
MDKPYLIDAHAHVNFAKFNEDRQEVIDRALNKHIWQVNVGTSRETSEQAVALAKKYKQGVYATVGLHPVHTSPSFFDGTELEGGSGQSLASLGEQFDLDFYTHLAQEKKVVGIGECGLDYFRLEIEQKDIQIKNFVNQIHLANSVNKPLMLHLRSGADNSAYTEAIDILEQESKVVGDVHFFAGSKAEAQKFLDLGFYISFTGVITFARDYKELVEYVPIDRIIVETDCPYVAPAPFRGRRNEPLYVEEVARQVAELKNLSLAEVARATTNNWGRLFGGHINSD